MSHNTLRPLPNWLEEFIELFIKAPSYVNTVFAVGKDGELHEQRAGERKATLRELFSALSHGIMKTKEKDIDTFTLEKLKNKCKLLIKKAKKRSQGKLQLLKFFRTLAAEIEFWDLEQEITSKEFLRYSKLTENLDEMTQAEAREYIVLFVQFFTCDSKEHSLLARKLLRTLPFIETLLVPQVESQDFIKAWRLLCLALYKDAKLLEALAGMQRFITIPVWAEQQVKDILKYEFFEQSIPKSLIKMPFTKIQFALQLSPLEPPTPKGNATQELMKHFEPMIANYYKDLLAEAGAEVFVEKRLPYFIPQGTFEKLHAIEKEIAKQRILKSMQVNAIQASTFR